MDSASNSKRLRAVFKLLDGPEYEVNRKFEISLSYHPNDHWKVNDSFCLKSVV